ncbi:MAG: type II toxin-antitoxin system HicB family antitoxin [Bacteroidetes bacterium]|nr:type II toxin-antitoxin system HicB family antitoxin [Bacteroidota bacterium]MCL6100423.1 type II toxin-antitoxin system HicB family antitoxin [Bacteroidota bacterium]
MKKSKAIMASIEIKKNDDGFLARIPGIQGAFAEGDTVEEAVFNCIEVVKMIFEYRKERNESLGFNEFDLTKNKRMTFAFPIGV